MKASIAVLLSLSHLLTVEPAAVVLHCGVTALCVCVLTCITPSQFLSAHSSIQSLKVDSSISSLAGQGEEKKSASYTSTHTNTAEAPLAALKHTHFSFHVVESVSCPAKKGGKKD